VSDRTLDKVALKEAARRIFMRPLPSDEWRPFLFHVLETPFRPAKR
jgi:hypothetical protein